MKTFRIMKFIISSRSLDHPNYISREVENGHDQIEFEWGNPKVKPNHSLKITSGQVLLKVNFANISSYSIY